MRFIAIGFSRTVVHIHARKGNARESERRRKQKELRELRRKIEDEVESLLSEEIIAGKLVKGDIPTLKYIKKEYKLVKE